MREIHIELKNVIWQSARCARVRVLKEPKIRHVLSGASEGTCPRVRGCSARLEAHSGGGIRLWDSTNAEKAPHAVT